MSLLIFSIIDEWNPKLSAQVDHFSVCSRFSGARCSFTLNYRVVTKCHASLYIMLSVLESRVGYSIVCYFFWRILHVRNDQNI